MKHSEYINTLDVALLRSLLKPYPTLKKSCLLISAILVMGCADFVEVQPPKNTLVSETVFNDAATVESALANLYYDMREQGMVSGAFGLTTAMGIYSDELDYYGFSADYVQLFQHNVLPGNGAVLEWWRQAYHLIYGANDIIKGVDGTDGLTTVEKNSFKGQALFIRAYLHSLLVSVFGDVPYVETTDYLKTNTVVRTDVDEVNDLIIADLEAALVLLEGAAPVSDERIYPDQNVVKALLARMHLYIGYWEEAAAMATELIDDFPLESDLNQVFLKGSQETIWQLKADNESPKNTREAEQLIIQSVPGQTYALTNDLLNAFEADDLRRDQWVNGISDMDNTVTYYYAHKYKAGINENEALEYSILFRSAEQMLIRAEARIRLGDIVGAQSDLNAIRNRAGLANTMASTQNEILDAIINERRFELFTEQGHRWFDLKRLGKADEILGQFKPNWKATDVRLPIPESELDTNPNLLPQNPGY